MTGVLCRELEEAFSPCEPTEDGLRFTTHCLYPSFARVSVYIVRMGTSTVIHDGGGAARAAWMHGRDHGLITRSLKQQASAHHLELSKETLSLRVEADEWIPAGIMAVANASASAAHSAAETAQQVSESALYEMIRAALMEIVGSKNVGSEVSVRGRSGKKHTFDFGIRQGEEVTLIDAVTPHHVSIASRYMAFADTSGTMEGVRGRFVIHDKPLETEDVALLTQYADVVPAKSLRPAFKKYFGDAARH